MKKNALAALAIIGATMGMGAVPQNVPTANQQAPSQGQNQKHNEGVDRQITTVRRGPVTPLNPAGIGDISWGNPGRSPKEYGMYLQQTGRQKWVKKKRK
jgi:hypothetical protein